jgi:N-dimethylarginine dimethylaminohydrolase
MKTGPMTQRDDVASVMPLDAAAYGGAGWSPRSTSHISEIGTTWAACGITNEFSPLRHVLLHRPGDELSDVGDVNAALMLELPRLHIAQRQHDALADAYRASGVHVTYVDPPATPPPNLMFVADLVFMTPAGAILARPASTARAGEERWIARRLADVGVPVLRMVAGTGVFEGADAMWLDAATVAIGMGLRTNAEGAAQVAATLAEQNVDAVIVDVAHDVMHLMADLRIVDNDLAYVRPTTPAALTDALRTRGYDVRCFPDAAEVEDGFAYNFVTIGPRRIVMPAGCPNTERAFRAAGIDCITVDVDELTKAAGAIGCLTGVLHRENMKIGSGR